MTESKKALLGLFIFLAAIGAFVVSCPAERQSIGLGYAPAITLFLACVAAGYGIWRLSQQKDEAPDFLAQLSPRPYFDGGGFCFRLAPPADGRSMMVRIYFQNRYEKPCRAEVAFRPNKLFSRGVPELWTQIDCPGGAFGFIEIPWAVPSKASGKKLKLWVYAAAEYPHGKGRELRHRPGLFVSTAPTLAGQAKNFGVGGTRAYSKITFPKNIITPAMALPRTSILWTLGEQLPALGFPVLPA